MTLSFGNLSLLISLTFAFLQLFNFFNKKNIIKFAVFGLLFSSMFSFFYLMYSYIISDFSLINVFENSHSTKPLIYKISGVWGNHEGSMLLWLLVLCIFNFFILKLNNNNNYFFILRTLQIQAIIIIGFLLFILLTSNPFDKMPTIPLDGLGFNPILQDPALAFHPPLLYIGYVGFSASFSLSVATMSLKKLYDVPWYRYMKIFVGVAWTFLTLGIGLGSVWAYYELGWGGWWFWDPVENAALMPWLLGTALFHSLITVEKKKSLQSWVLLLAILSFLLSLIGTFLVRSGILTSVHTFALDPSRGIYILSFIGFLGGYALLLYAIKSKNFFTKNNFSFFSREGAILANNIMMAIVCASVFFGTTYPLFVEIFTSNRISVGEPYFNATIIPMIVPAILIMGIGPILSWGQIKVKSTLIKILPSIIITISISSIFFLIYRNFNFLGLIGIGLFSWIISNILISLKTNKFIHSINMLIAHLGVAIIILGITGSSIWQKEQITRMNLNDSVEINNYKIIFKKIEKISESNYIGLKGSFNVINKKNKIVAILNPENRFYPVTKMSTTEASIHTNLIRDLYIVIGDGNIKDGWIIRIYYNPLVIWIWIGTLTIFLGGLLTIIDNIKILKFRKNEK